MKILLKIHLCFRCTKNCCILKSVKKENKENDYSSVASDHLEGKSGSEIINHNRLRDVKHEIRIISARAELRSYQTV
jgi:uncharacterized cysteine cluster protein YcgN (CxxCxxCC family)